jgi:hypothetical protein
MAGSPRCCLNLNMDKKRTLDLPDDAQLKRHWAQSLAYAI